MSRNTCTLTAETTVGRTYTLSGASPDTVADRVHHIATDDAGVTWFDRDESVANRDITVVEIRFV